MPKVILEGYIVVPDSDMEKVSNELPVHIDLTKNEEGCLIFNVAQDEVVKNKFHVYEEFTDQEAFSAHQDRVRNSKWGTVTKDVERFYEITELDE